MITIGVYKLKELSILILSRLEVLLLHLTLITKAPSIIM
ncbi:hypothetical protein LSGJ_00666 [Ligilactobacillus salivarius GJ-24]|uniref:Uncharacterized protein n=1 Tax=Ligilactobacillus salivarius GJ-24 TaxID=1041521 RepID=F7QT22_9LACO|nr:hypothetical protein LSGJ_00666 [Ligilactobacillus salivarius GJ-24]